MATKLELEQKVKELELELKMTVNTYEKMFKDVKRQLEIQSGAIFKYNSKFLGE